MKQLLLFRHAKSSWDDKHLADFDRPLNERGLATAPFMGELLAQRDLLPGEIVSSPAKRAIQTATLFKESSGSDAPIRLEERIYEASPHSLFQIAVELHNEHERVMFVGHNPGIEGFIGFLTGQLEPMPTAAVAIIDLKVEHWKEVKFGCGNVVEVIRPKEHIAQPNN